MLPMIINNPDFKMYKFLCAVYYYALSFFGLYSVLILILNCE